MYQWYQKYSYFVNMAIPKYTNTNVRAGLKWLPYKIIATNTGKKKQHNDNNVILLLQDVDVVLLKQI